jgi:hypothetical protein
MGYRGHGTAAVFHIDPMTAKELLALPVGTRLSSDFYEQGAEVAGRFRGHVWLLLSDGAGFSTGPHDDDLAELASYLETADETTDIPHVAGPQPT